MSGILFGGGRLGLFLKQAGKEFKNSKQCRCGKKKKKQDAAEAKNRDKKTFESQKESDPFQGQQVADSSENNQPDADEQECEKLLLLQGVLLAVLKQSRSL